MIHMQRSPDGTSVRCSLLCFIYHNCNRVKIQVSATRIYIASDEALESNSFTLSFTGY